MPCTRIPARCRRHCSARRLASARSTKVSPANNDRRTNGTVRLTRGLSCGLRTLAGSTAKPHAWAYSTNAWFSRGSVASARSTTALRLSGTTVANTPP